MAGPLTKFTCTVSVKISPFLSIAVMTIRLLPDVKASVLISILKSPAQARRRSSGPMLRCWAAAPFKEYSNDVIFPGLSTWPKILICCCGFPNCPKDWGEPCQIRIFESVSVADEARIHPGSGISPNNLSSLPIDNKPAKIISAIAGRIPLCALVKN